MTHENLKSVESCTGSPVSGSVIWLHGLGADGHDFEPIVPQLRPANVHLRFVFPHAPVRPVTINNGITMPAWFDITGLERRSRQDEAGIREAESQIQQLVRRENERGISTDSIVLAGFSQGAALALHTALRFPERLAGIIGLSTYLPLAWTIDAEALEANRNTPIFLGHGTLDPLVSVTLGSEARDFLRARGFTVEWKTYPIDHSVCPEEIEHIREFLGNALS